MKVTRLPPKTLATEHRRLSFAGAMPCLHERYYESHGRNDRLPRFARPSSRLRVAPTNSLSFAGVMPAFMGVTSRNFAPGYGINRSRYNRRL